jgi:GLPGLI family protein
MRKILLLSALTAFLTVSGYSQDYYSQYSSLAKYIGKRTITVVDSAKMRITYSLDFIPDSLNPKQVYKDRKILLIGDTVNNFFSYYVRQQDLHQTDDFDKGKNSARLKFDRDVLGEGYEIFTNYPKTGKITVMDYVTNLSVYQYEENIEPIKWLLQKDTCTVLGYLCQKATTNLYGRSWEVWYCLTIPVDAGPWRLRGLPGLIMKAYDSRKHYVFECIGIERTGNKKEAIIKNKGSYNHFSQCTREEYRKAQKRFYDNHIDALRTMGFNVNIEDENGNRIERLPTFDKSMEERKISWTTTVDRSSLNKKLPYNPIELE